ncbi:MAG: hypothetical protein IPK20_08025 [Betaproteobacteria bacterium]|nr:hypothetical protein [Betaproteobacteria bacterium]
MRECLRQGRHRRLLEWIACIPPGVAADSPTIQYAEGSAVAIDDPLRALASISMAHRGYLQIRDVAGGARCACAMIEIIFHATADHGAMLPWIDELARILENGFQTTDSDLTLRCHASMLIARLFARPDRQLEHSATAVLAMLPVAASTRQRLLATVYLTIYATFAGRFDLTPALEAQGDHLAGQAQVTAYDRAHWHLWKACMLRLAETLRRRCRFGGKADAIAAAEGFGQIAFLAAYFASGAEASRGRLEAAAALEARAEASVDSSKPLQVALLSACSAWLAMYRQDGWQARRCGERAMSVARTLSAPSYRIHYGIPFVYGLAETGALNEARGAGGTATCDRRHRADVFRSLLLAVEARIEELDGNVDRSIVLVRAMWRCAESTGHGDYLHWVKPWVVRCRSRATGRRGDHVCRQADPPPRLAGRTGLFGMLAVAGQIHALGRFTLRVGGEVPRHGRKAPRRPPGTLCVC